MLAAYTHFHPFEWQSASSQLVTPLPLILDLALAGLTSKGHFMEGQFVSSDKIVLLVHIWSNIESAQKSKQARNRLASWAAVVHGLCYRNTD